MKRAATVLRHYHEADAAMRQEIRTMHGHFTTHQAAFAAFNPEFGGAFGTDWLAALNTADTTPTGTVRVGELKEDTAEVTSVMEQAQGAVQSLFYFVGRAFPHNAGRLKQYGRDTYDAARDSHDKMRTLLQTAFASATRDHVALAAKGYTPAQLAALGTLGTQLTTTNTTQEVKKGTNTEGTDHYLTVQNLAYGYGQGASAAAKILFASDKATLDLFRLGGAAPAAHETHEVTVAEKGTATVVFATALADATRLHLRLAVPQGHQAARVARVAAAGDAPTVYVTLTTQISETDVQAVALGATGQVLVVENGGPGAVRVEIAVRG